MSNYIRTAPKISGNRFYVYKFLVQIIISWYIERHSYKNTVEELSFGATSQPYAVAVASKY